MMSQPPTDKTNGSHFVHCLKLAVDSQCYVRTYAVCAALDSEARPLLAALDIEARPLTAPALAPVVAVDVALLAFARNRPAVLMRDTTAAELRSEILA